MATDYKAAAGITPKVQVPLMDENKLRTEQITAADIIKTDSNEMLLRHTALTLATWKTYRTAASGNQTIELADRMLAYLKEGKIPK